MNGGLISLQNPLPRLFRANSIEHAHHPPTPLSTATYLDTNLCPIPLLSTSFSASASSASGKLPGNISLIARAAPSSYVSAARFN